MSHNKSGKPSPNLGWRAIDVLLGQFGKWTDKAAADAIGVSTETWRSWKYRKAKPGTDHLSRLFHRFGPRFMAFVTAPFDEAHLDEMEARLDREIRDLTAKKRALAARRSMGGAQAGNARVEAFQVVAPFGEEDA